MDLNKFSLRNFRISYHSSSSSVLDSDFMFMMNSARLHLERFEKLTGADKLYKYVSIVNIDQTEGSIRQFQSKVVLGTEDQKALVVDCQ